MAKNESAEKAVRGIRRRTRRRFSAPGVPVGVRHKSRIRTSRQNAAFLPYPHGMAEATADVGVFVGTPGVRWRGHFCGRVTRYALGDRSTSIRVGLEQRLTLTSNAALRASTAFERDFGESWLHAVVSWNLYF